MKKRVLSLALIATMTAALFAGCTGKTNNNAVEDLSSLNGSYDITVWVSESAGVTDLTQKQIAKFCELHPGITINPTIEGVTEADSASKMITDVATGADLYCFAQDQLSRLVEAGALAALGEGAQATVKAANDATSIKASSVGDVIYCYPMTSDNGYFMFYDKSVVKESSIDDLAKILEDCAAANKNFSMETETSAWYVASFFFATGCVSEWSTNSDGKFVSIDDTFNSEAGLIAMKGMQQLVQSGHYVSSSSTADFAAAVPSAVVVSGTWGVNAAKEALGENYAVADLPSFTVDGKSYHMGSYSGCKLMGVKPQTDAKKAALLQKLALYLTTAECQLERFELVGWGPSNLEAQKNEKVASDPALVALAAQAAYATPQGNISGSWWDIGKALGTVAVNAKSDDDLKAGLDAYTEAINGVLNMDESVANAFTVVGGIASLEGDAWGQDAPMVEEPAGTWTSDPIELKAGEEFKCRQGKSWDVSFGKDGGNYVVEADGTYKIQLVFDGENGEITLIPAE